MENGHAIDPLLAKLAKEFDRLTTREQILEAISELEEAYDSMSEIEQEAADKLIEELNRRLERGSP